MRYQDRERVKRVTAEAARAEKNGWFTWARDQWNIARHMWSKLGNKSEENYCKVRSMLCSNMAIEKDEPDDDN